MEDGPSILRPHGFDYHDVAAVAAVQADLLDWFEAVRWGRTLSPMSYLI